MDIFALRMNALARMEHIHVGNEDDEMTFVSWIIYFYFHVYGLEMKKELNVYIYKLIISWIVHLNMMLNKLGSGSLIFN